MNKKQTVLIPLADGVEEMEAVIVVDTLRRAGWDVITASLTEGVVKASRGVKLVADAVLSDVLHHPIDGVVIPGGLGGVEALRDCVDLLAYLQQGELGWVGAICAGPLVLQDVGMLKEKTYTSHPSVADRLTDGCRVDEPVVVDGRLITSQGPGTALAFALKIIECIDGRESAEAVSGPMCVPS